MATNIVDTALDKYMAQMGKRGVNATGVKAATLARLAGVPTPLMSTLLQEYRQRQGGGGTRYVVGCEGYGSRARWQILAKPGSDPRVVQQARVRHAEWVSEDVVTRYLRDSGLEVAPALKGAQQDPVISQVVKTIASTLEGTLQLVKVVLGNGSGPAGAAPTPTP